LRVALCQINATIADFEGNRRKIADCAAKAAEQGADLAVFPELTVTGYPPRDLLERPDFLARADETLKLIVEDSRQWPNLALVLGALSPNPDAGKPLFNEAWVVKGGRVLSIHRKALLPNYDVFDEDRYFEPAPAIALSHAGGEPLGVTICEDIWNDKHFWSGRRYRSNPIQSIADGGAKLLVNLSASPYSWGKGRLRHDLLRQIAVDHGFPIVYVNLVGGNDSLVFDGRSLAVAADGTLLAVGASFEEDLLVVDIPGAGEPATPNADAADRLNIEEMEGVHGALVLGLRDYARKCGFKSVVLGLSGGIDSAVTAVLAVDALGRENVFGAFMPTRYTSALSREQARLLADNLGITMKDIPIDGIFQAYLDDLAAGLDGLPGDATEENIQARIRGNVLMALSNRFGHLLLSTGNKSEIAVGYCTLYGDMAGGLCVISDLYKTEVYRLAEHLNRHEERIPQGTISRPPSAELKPNQTDQDSLPPYEVLDDILRRYIDENEDEDAIVDGGFDRKTVRDVIRRLEVSEYKRQQAAPGLRVSWKAFGMGRRYPIARKIVTSSKAVATMTTAGGPTR
jgi:NAD+ synthase (glutamine-hydrolysing)